MDAGSVALLFALGSLGHESLSTREPLPNPCWLAVSRASPNTTVPSLCASYTSYALTMSWF
eukprot:2661505-Amphidinium_carterae.1